MVNATLLRVILCIVITTSAACTTKTVNHVAIDGRTQLTRMLISDEPCTPLGECQVLAIITVQKQWYTGEDDINADLAREAHKIGADAVVEVVRGRKVTAFSWASPYGSGKAIKFVNKPAIDMNKFREVFF